MVSHLEKMRLDSTITGTYSKENEITQEHGNVIILVSNYAYVDAHEGAVTVFQQKYRQLPLFIFSLREHTNVTEFTLYSLSFISNTRKLTVLQHEILDVCEDITDLPGIYARI